MVNTISTPKMSWNSCVQEPQRVMGEDVLFNQASSNDGFSSVHVDGPIPFSWNGGLSPGVSSFHSLISENASEASLAFSVPSMFPHWASIHSWTSPPSSDA